MIVVKVALIKINMSFQGKSCPPGEKKHPDNLASYRWWLPTASAGKSVGLPCPSGSNGSATWTCDQDGMWERSPDLR